MNGGSRGVAAAHYAKEHRLSLPDAARLYGVTRECVRQKWRELYGDEPTPFAVAFEASRSQREADIRRLANAGLSPAEIANEISCSVDTVISMCDRAGIAVISARDKRGLSKETKARIIELARQGRTKTQIAREIGTIGTHLSAVSRWLARNGVSAGGGHGCKASQFMDATGCSVGEAATRFGISRQALHAYRRSRGLKTSKDSKLKSDG